MTAGGFLVRSDALDYLSGRSPDPHRRPRRWRPVPDAARHVEHVRGIGVTDTTSADDTAASFPTEAMIAGLAGDRIPFAFQVTSRPGGVEFAVGTWGADDHGRTVLPALLDGVAPRVDRVVTTGGPTDRHTLGGIATGTPVGEIHDGHAPWDRLLRGLRGATFSAVVVAQPVDPDRIARLRDVALEDLRTAGAAQGGRTDLPLTQAYVDRLREVVDSLDLALSAGGWRTGVYLTGDQAGYHRLAAAWRGVFSAGERPLATVQVLPADEAVTLARDWALPDDEAPAGPRAWRHPYGFQTLLDSRALAALVHFPRRETAGFAVRPAPAFAVTRPVATTRAVDLGNVLEQDRVTGGRYAIPLDALTRHTFVAGLTGSGKSNTIMGLLGEVAAADVPFLVIEPAKTEYRAMLAHPRIGPRLRVYTPGRETVAPLRINPFEVPDGVDVTTHLDLVKAVFTASFAMWIPLPQVLEQCLVQLYTERGWDFTTGRPRPGLAPSVPTLADLSAAVVRTVPTLGYKGETTMEITASLTTRLDALRRGARGLMFDVDRSMSMAELLGEPTVIELEGLGDDGDKAFLMGLLLIRLYEHRRAAHAAALADAAARGAPAPRPGRLSHLVVVEEAHRLLAASDKQTDSWHADPGGAFAETFAQMLSEVRAYGQGMVIADQVPVRLAPDVVKNTNLKIAHRLVAGDDRAAMAAAMAMDPTQSTALATLAPGRAAVFSEGDHTPVVVAVRPVKDLDDAPAVDDAAVAAAMATRRPEPSSRSGVCAGVCATPADCTAARGLVDDPHGGLLAGRLLTTSTGHVDGLDVLWPEVVAFVAARSAGEDLDAAVHRFAVHAMASVISRRTVQGRWPAAGVAALTAAVRSALAERAATTARWLGTTPARLALLDAATPLMRRIHDPFPLCAAVCPDGSCRYRDPVADLLRLPRYAEAPTDAGSHEQVTGFAAAVAQHLTATSELAPTDAGRLNAARWQAVACVAQAKYCADDRPHESSRTVVAALAAAGWTLTLKEQS